MNLILVPRSAGRGRHISLSPGQLIMLVVTLLLALPLVLGAVAYKIAAAMDSTSGSRDPVYIQQQAALLSNERQMIEQARRDAEIHLNALAQRLGHMQAELLRLNALGQRLVRMANLDKREFDFSIEPAMGGPETSPGLSSLAVPDFVKALENVSGQIEKKTERLSALESTLIDKKLHAAVHPTGWPSDGGWISSGFGVRSDPFTGRSAMHAGVDIAARMGSPILAMGDGIVTFTGEQHGYGLTIEVTHVSGLVTRYAHTREVLAKTGERVKKGQKIALVGTSGRSTGPHLHIEVLRNGHATNPIGFLKNPRHP